MISDENAAQYASHWIDAWNAHDLELILAHYRADVILTSPLAVRLAGSPGGVVRGLPALREYFARGLAAYPDHHLEPIDALPGVGSVALRYRSIDGREAIEVVELDRWRRIYRAASHYSLALPGDDPS